MGLQRLRSIIHPRKQQKTPKCPASDDKQVVAYSHKGVKGSEAKKEPLQLVRACIPAPTPISQPLYRRARSVVAEAIGSDSTPAEGRQGSAGSSVQGLTKLQWRCLPCRGLRGSSGFSSSSCSCWQNSALGGCRRGGRFLAGCPREVVLAPRGLLAT